MAAAAAAMAVWTWRIWPDPFIDFGREAYVAWRLSEGAVLHRDVVTVSGPLSPWWNALLFRVFGAHLDTLFVANAFVAAATAAIWWRLLVVMASRSAAFAGAIVFVTLFGFAQFVGIGNYNHIAPYAHELTHGLLLASAGLLLWERILRSGSRPAWFGAGLLLGLTALTKIEVFVAAGAAQALGLAVAVQREREQPAGTPRGIAFFALGAGLPVGLAFVALAVPLGAPEALRALAIGWVRVFGDDVASLPFYRQGMGTDFLAGNLGLAALWTARIGGVLAPAAVAALALPEGRTRPLAAVAAFGVAALGLGWLAAEVPWLQAARALPLFALGATVYCASRLARRDARRTSRGILQAMAAVFATVLLAKIFFLGRIYQYGFVLALPASLLFVAALVSWIPGEIERRGGSPAVFRAAAFGLLAAVVYGHLLVMAPQVAAKTTALGPPGDAIRVEPGVAQVVTATLRTVREHTRPGGRVAVLPEGALLNFWLRRATPTAHFSFNPFELHVYGETEILDSFEATPPDAVVLFHQDTREHGARFLGRDYGRQLMSWIDRRYETVRLIGEPPLEPGTVFGARVLVPRSSLE